MNRPIIGKCRRQLPLGGQGRQMTVINVVPYIGDYDRKYSPLMLAVNTVSN